MKTTRLAALAALVLTAAVAAVALRTTAAHGDSVPVSERGIVVAGSGSATSVPDRGSFSFTVATPGKTAAAAVAANAAAMRAVVAALRQAGVAAADLQTTQVSLEQRRSENGDTVTGYDATSSVLAQLRDLGRAGAVVDAAVAAGADEFSGPALSTGDTEQLYRDALKAAVADARGKAQALAAAAGLTLGRVTNVTEGGGQPVPVMQTAKADTVAVEPGTQEIQATVTVSFAAA
jgi:uncharacterized protein YggE